MQKWLVNTVDAIQWEATVRLFAGVSCLLFSLSSLGNDCPYALEGAYDGPDCPELLQEKGSVEHVVYRNGYHVLVRKKFPLSYSYHWLKYDPDRMYCTNFRSSYNISDYWWVTSPKQIRTFINGFGEWDFSVGYDNPLNNATNSAELARYRYFCDEEALVPYTNSGLSSNVVSHFTDGDRLQYWMTPDKLFVGHFSVYYQIPSLEVDLKLEPGETIVKANAVDTSLFFWTEHPKKGWRIKAFDRIDDETSYYYRATTRLSKTFNTIEMGEPGTLASNLFVRYHYKEIADYDYKGNVDGLELSYLGRDQIVHWVSYTSEGKKIQEQLTEPLDHSIKLTNLEVLVKRDQLEVVAMGSRNEYPWFDVAKFSGLMSASNSSLPASGLCSNSAPSGCLPSYTFLYVIVGMATAIGFSGY